MTPDPHPFAIKALGTEHYDEATEMMFHHLATSNRISILIADLAAQPDNRELLLKAYSLMLINHARQELKAAGWPLTQDEKYTTDGLYIINRETLEAIPHDEPIFILRGRDKLALKVLEFYHSIIAGADHIRFIGRAIEMFRSFSHKNPKRMKLPDTGRLIRRVVE